MINNLFLDGKFEICHSKKKKTDKKNLWYFVRQIIVKRDWLEDIDHDLTSKA